MDSNKKEQADLNSNGQNVVLMLDPNENDSMLSLKDLLYSVLRNLGVVLIAGVVLGGALFAYKIIKQSPVSTSYTNGLSVRDDKETDVEYEERMQKLGRARDIVNASAKVNSQIEHQRKYLSDSVYMQIDAENVYETKGQFVISVNENVAGGVDRALVAAYQNAVQGGDYLDEYAAKNDLRADYIKEVMYFDSQISDGAILSAEGSAGKVASFNVRVIGPSQEFTDDVIDLVKKKVFTEYDKLKKSVTDHSLTLVGIQENVKVDPSIRDNQVNQTSKIETLQKQIVGYNDTLDQLAKDLKVSGKEELIEYFKEEHIEDETTVTADAPEMNVSFWGTVKPGIKYGLIGFVAGAFVVAVILVLIYVFGKKIATQAQFFSKFGSVKKIGVLKPTGKRCKYTAFIDIKSEDDTKMSADNNIKLISNNYNNIIKGMDKIIITGTGDRKAMDEAVKKLGLKGDYKPDLFSDPDILKIIPDYDGVVLLEQRNASLYKTVANEIALIDNTGTKIVGAIII